MYGTIILFLFLHRSVHHTSSTWTYPETKFHIQRYDGLENIEKRSRALKVTLGSSTDPNLGHNPIEI